MYTKQGLAMFIAGCFFAPFGILCFIWEMPIVGALELSVGLLFLVAFWPGRAKKEREEIAALQEQVRQEEERLQKEQQRKLEQYASGTWDFPTLKLYDKCAASGVKELDSEFALQKAMQVGTAVMSSEGVPQEYHGLYCNRENIKAQFDTGKMLRAEIDETVNMERRTPKDGELNEQEKRCVQLASDLRGKKGQDKRVYMLSRAIGDIYDQMRNYREGQEAMKTLGMIYASSVSQTPKHDWAILGGIAEGIAGPGAGIAVAANAMIENQRIEEQNRRARAAATQLIGDLYSGRAKLDSSIGDLENEKKLLMKYQEEAAYKVVLNGYTKEALFKGLDVSASVRKLSGGKGLKLNVTINNCFKADVPDGVKVATDGTLNAKIFFDKTLVDEVCVPLPLFGVECDGGWESVDMYSDRYVEADGEYTVKFEPNDLWVIEI